MNTRKNYEQYKKMMRFFSALFLMTLETAVFTYAWYNYFNLELRRPFYGKGNLLMVLVYVLLLLAFSAAFGGLKIGYMRKSNVMLSQALSIISMHVIIFVQILLISGKMYRIPSLAAVTVTMTLIDIVIAVLWILIFHYWYYKVFPPRKMLLIYQDRPPDPLLKKMYLRKDKYNICESMNIAVGMEQIRELILQYDGVILFDLHAKIRNNLLKYCYTYEIRTYTTPKISDIILRNSEILHLFDTPLLLSRNLGLSFEQKVVKRIVDIVISGAALVITSPIMLLTAVAIRISDRGPALFRQTRVTVNEKEFNLYKFRSMIVNAEKNGVAVLAAENDKRITPIGKFIRATRIDELPQLWNILKGDMSLVGPRPERPEIIAKYEKVIPEFAYRLKVKAGLTGYAQIYGKYNTTAYDKLKLDLMYIENYSFLLELRIIFQTVKVIFMKESTEGVNKTESGEALRRERDSDD